MRLAFVALVSLVFGSTTAGAEPKPLPPKLAQAAGEAFGKARAAETKGDYQEAVRQYERAMAIAPHPNTQFNIAEAQRAAKNFEGAAKSYEKYLELAPDASDRARVEKLIKELRAMPGTIDVTTEDSGALAYVDGVVVGPAPGKFDIAAGTHQLDIVTPITFAHQACTTTAGHRSTCRAGGPPRADGNVIISASWNIGGLSWPVGHQRFQVHGRFVATSGHYDLTIDKRQCQPLPLEVPAGDVLTYAYIKYPDVKPTGPECLALSIAQHRVVFP